MKHNSKLTLYKRTNGFYYVSFYRDGTRKWLSTKCTTQADALQFIKGLDLNSKPKERSTITLQDFFNQLKASKSTELRPTTLRSYGCAMDDFLANRGDRTIDSYSQHDIEDWKSSVMSRENSPLTFNAYFRSVRAVFGYAVKRELIPDTPFKKLREIKVPQREPVYFSQDDVKALLAKVDEPMLKELFTFAALTGMRLSEITHLQWSAIDLEHGRVTISNNEEFTTKSGKIRVLPLHPILIEMLRGRSNEGSKYVFHKNGYRFNNGYISHRLKYYVGEAKLNKKLHFHSLRHGCASQLAQAGVPIISISALLGHADIKTTMIYSHVAPSTLVDAVGVLGI